MNTLTTEQVREALTSGLKAGGVIGAYGMVKLVDGRYILIDFEMGVVEAAGLVSFMEKKVDATMLELLYPKDTSGPKKAKKKGTR